MQWAALSASQSEPSFSLGCLSLHCARGMPLTQTRQSANHTHICRRTQTDTHTHHCAAIYHHENKRKLQEESGGMTIVPSSYSPTFLSKRPLLRLNLNVKWDWLDYGRVKSEKGRVRRMGEGVQRRYWGRANRRGALKYRGAQHLTHRTHLIFLDCTRFLTATEPCLVWSG